MIDEKLPTTRYATARRLLVVSSEVPWPANHGARADVWYRYQGLAELGWELALLCWARPEQYPSDADMKTMREVFCHIFILPKPVGKVKNLMRLVRMLRLPSLVAARRISRAEFGDVVEVLRRAPPDAVISESVYAAVWARRVACVLRVPIFVRSHNIEHRYMRTQLDLAASTRSRLSIRASLLHLKKYETKTLCAVNGVFDISRTDALFWNKLGVANVYWMPSVFPALEDSAVAIPYNERPYDVGYVGNLWAPNNVEAVIWFTDKILPILMAARSDIRVLIAGANPIPYLCDRLTQIPSVTLLPNPEDAAVTRAQARVLINPVAAGSGLNTKSVEMLYCDSPLVVTSFAVAGMQENAREGFWVADSPEEFAALVLKGVKTPFVPDAARLRLRNYFGREGLLGVSQLIDYAIRKETCLDAV